jgi:glycosyltransferase involved in cell wall biosynthesis
MQILIVDHDAGPPHRRGLYRALARSSNVGITLLIPDRWHDGFVETAAEGEASPNFCVIPARTLFTGRVHRFVAPALWNLLRKRRFDLLYLNAEPENFQAFHALVGRQLFSPSTRMVLISWRNIDFPKGVYPYRAQFLHALCERATLPYIDALVAGNETVKGIFEQKGLRRIPVIPLCVDTELFSPSNREEREHRSEDARFTVGYVGRLVPEKGVDTLLQASAALSFDHEVLIVGSGPEEDRLRTLARGLGVSRQVCWNGPILHACLPEKLRALDVLVLPSRTTPLWKEQFGRVLIEAMACGVPVIGSDSGEIPTTIGSAGLTFPEGDTAALATLLQRIHDDQSLASDLSTRSRQRAETAFSITSVAEQYLSFFNSVSYPKLVNL